MYYLILIAIAAIIVSNPEKVSDALPGMNEVEKQQMRSGLESISQGISDTTNAGLNAILRKIMGRDN
jgi:hypothetical protein